MGKDLKILIMTKLKNIIINIVDFMKKASGIFHKINPLLERLKRLLLSDNKRHKKQKDILLDIQFNESLNKLRVNIDTVISENKCIIFSSPRRLEGKTMLCIKMAKYMSKLGKKTLLIDCNMRNPQIGDIFNIDNKELGLSDVLGSDQPWEKLVFSTNLKNLFIMHSGSTINDPVGLLSSDKMGDIIDNAINWFDYVLIDTPAILLVPDTISLAKHGGNIFLIVRHQFTKQKDIDNALDILNMANCKVKGIICNDMPVSNKEKKYKYNNI
jgi:capsular exopolysaccharide synthesis family protein